MKPSQPSLNPPTNIDSLFSSLEQHINRLSAQITDLHEKLSSRINDLHQESINLSKSIHEVQQSVDVFLNQHSLQPSALSSQSKSRSFNTPKKRPAEIMLDNPSDAQAVTTIDALAVKLNASDSVCTVIGYLYHGYLRYGHVSTYVWPTKKSSNNMPRWTLIIGFDAPNLHQLHSEFEKKLSEMFDGAQRNNITESKSQLFRQVLHASSWNEPPQPNFDEFIQSNIGKKVHMTVTKLEHYLGNPSAVIQTFKILDDQPWSLL